jgi:transposase-like protein
MGQILHGSATTTEAVRRAIQHSQESLRALASRRGFNLKTVAKWRKRTTVADLPTGPRKPTSTVLAIEEEAKVRWRAEQGDARRSHLLPGRSDQSDQWDTKIGGESCSWTSRFPWMCST